MKLSFWTIIVMAISIAVGILSFAIFHQLLPTKAATDYYVTYKGQLDTELAKKRQVQRRVLRAKQAVKQKADAWNVYVATRTPESDVSRGGISLAVNPYQLTVDTQKFRNSIQRAVNAQVKKGGVKVVGAGPAVRGPASIDVAGDTLLADYYNYPGIKFPVVIFDFGQVVVQGTYAQIMANVRAYKTMPHYLAVADGLSISGTSPNLTGTYNLSIVGFIRGKTIFPTATSPAATAASATAATGTTGFPGSGMPPGMPGVPGGRMGGRMGAD